MSRSHGIARGSESALVACRTLAMYLPYCKARHSVRHRCHQPMLLTHTCHDTRSKVLSRAPREVDSGCDSARSAHVRVRSDTLLYGGNARKSSARSHEAASCPPALLLNPCGLGWQSLRMRARSPGHADRAGRPLSPRARPHHAAASCEAIARSLRVSRIAPAMYAAVCARIVRARRMRAPRVKLSGSL